MTNKRRNGTIYDGLHLQPYIKDLQDYPEKGLLQSWSSIAQLNLNKLLKTFKATAIWHINQYFSTFLSTESNTATITEDMFLTNSNGKRKYRFPNMVITILFNDTIYINLTGCFPYKSSHCKKYIMIVYNNVSNVV